MKSARALGESNSNIQKTSNNPLFPPILVQTINKIISTSTKQMQKPSFKFELNQEVVAHNSKILQEYDLNLDQQNQLH
jgi:hypothetical protein